MHNLYFDIAATTPLDKNVAELIAEVQSNVFGNPSSIHQFGQKARSIIEKSRRMIAKSLNCKPNEIIFTGGGSESNNLVLHGFLKPGDHLITTSYEHPAIIKVANKLEETGVEVSYVKPSSNGIVDVNDIENNIKDNTKLISVMYVNNEIGCINPISEINTIAKKNNIKIHTDAVQLIGKKHIDLNALDIDYLSITPHKYYGPKGIGALFIKSGNYINSILQGGGQEQKIRPGTENVAAIAGMGLATQIAIENIDINATNILELETLFLKLLTEKNINHILNGSNRIPGIMNITFPDILGQNLVMKLDLQGIAVSFGSACSSGTAKSSGVLLEIGLTDEQALRTIRISIGKFHNADDIYNIVDCIETVLKKNYNKIRDNYVE